MNLSAFLTSKKIFHKYDEKIPNLDIFEDIKKNIQIKEEKQINQKIEQNNKNDILVVDSDSSCIKEPPQHSEKNILKRNREDNSLDILGKSPQKRKKNNKSINGNGKFQSEKYEATPNITLANNNNNHSPTNFEGNNNYKFFGNYNNFMPNTGLDTAIDQGNYLLLAQKMMGSNGNFLSQYKDVIANSKSKFS